MGFTEFSTEKADYYFIVRQHLYNKNPYVFPSDIDGFVIENGYGDFKKYISGENASNVGRPIYTADPHLNLSGFLRGLLEICLIIPVVPIAYFYGFTNFRLNDKLGRIFSDYTWLIQDPIFEVRNAINASLIEDIVAPRLSELSHKKKPHIGILFGAAHMGIKYDLISQKRRDLTLLNWEKFNFSKNSGFKQETFGRVIEALPDGNEWKFSHLVR